MQRQVSWELHYFVFQILYIFIRKSKLFFIFKHYYSMLYKYKYNEKDVCFVTIKSAQVKSQ